MFGIWVFVGFNLSGNFTIKFKNSSVNDLDLQCLKYAPQHAILAQTKQVSQWNMIDLQELSESPWNCWMTIQPCYYAFQARIGKIASYKKIIIKFNDFLNSPISKANNNLMIWKFYFRAKMFFKIKNNLVHSF